MDGNPVHCQILKYQRTNDVQIDTNHLKVKQNITQNKMVLALR